MLPGSCICISGLKRMRAEPAQLVQQAQQADIFWTGVLASNVHRQQQYQEALRAEPAAPAATPEEQVIAAFM